MARPKGAKNKVGAEVKGQILACYERMGGLHAFERWAKTHENEFYRIYSQLAPKEISAEFTFRDESDLTDAELAAIATGSSAGASETESGEDIVTPVH